ncbi:MAG TPA: M13 family metallopeptidase N-terminal domain-containing protein, partial [Bacteroidales bacterium]|nr:M13 family metallopeptidase N-terminal domain-containing protein [Bacteroidales bacterium]
MNLNKTTLLAVICAGALITGCQSGKQEAVAVKAIDTVNMDQTIKPGDDFFRYANGNWIKSHPVPDQYADYGAFVQLAEENREQLKSLVQEAAGANGTKGSVTQQIGDFYKSGMDSIAIEKAGIEPLKADFDKIAKLGTGAELAAYYADLHMRGTYPVFAAFQMPDARQSEMVVLNLYQGGLGLPEVE